MGQATLSVHMDEDIMNRFDAFCNEVGINTTVAVNMFARAVLRENSIPFKISNKPAGIASLHKADASIEDKENWLNELVGVIPAYDKSDKELIADYLWDKYESIS